MKNIISNNEKRSVMAKTGEEKLKISASAKMKKMAAAASAISAECRNRRNMWRNERNGVNNGNEISAAAAWRSGNDNIENQQWRNVEMASAEKQYRQRNVMKSKMAKWLKAEMAKKRRSG
jgi:hypothetical protein